MTDRAEQSDVEVPQSVTWSPKLLPRSLVYLLVLVAFCLVGWQILRRSDLPEQLFVYLPLLIASVVVYQGIRIGYAARFRPYTLSVTPHAVWFQVAGSPAATELGRGEGAMLRLTLQQKIRFLAVVRPDGTSPHQIPLTPEVVPAVRDLALRAGWAWHEPPAEPQFPPDFDPRLWPVPDAVIPLTGPASHQPTRRTGIPMLVGVMVGVFAVTFYLMAGGSGVLAYLVSAAVLIAVNVLGRIRLRGRPGQSLVVGPDALRVIRPTGVAVIPRNGLGRITLSTSELRITIPDGRTVCRIRCPDALPAVRAELTRLRWPVSARSHQ